MNLTMPVHIRKRDRRHLERVRDDGLVKAARRGRAMTLPWS